MKHLLLAIFLFTLPLPVFALDYENCDTGTEECLCLPYDQLYFDQANVGSVAECQAECLESAEYQYMRDGYVSDYSVQCDLGGVLTTIAQGGIEEEIVESDTGEVVELEEDVYATPNLSVDIPGLEFTPGYKEDGYVKSNYLGEYIEAGYKWVLGAASLLAIVMLMLGGLQYMLARGKSEGIRKAKTRIRNAITGIVLLFGAFTIAFMVDPGSTTFDTLNTEYVVERVFDGDIAGELIFDEVYRSPEILCGSPYSYEEIATSMIGHVAYRYGGKGGPAPYDADTKIDPNGVAYSTYCPDDNLCLDCSGFVAYVSKCAGDPLPDGYSTRELFDGSSEKVTTCSGDGINGTDLNPGDLLGWNSDLEPSESGGHVFIYVGNGKVFDAYGSGREPGILAAQWTIPSVCEHYGEILWLLRR